MRSRFSLRFVAVVATLHFATVDFAIAVCGDGTLEAPAEQCDDGNVEAGDCCAPDCSWGEFGGNALTEPIARWSDSEKIRHARTMVSGDAPARDGVPCSTCEVFERMRETGNWVDASAVDVRRAVRTGDRPALARALHERLRARRTKE